MSTIKHVIIAAAGMGTRLGHGLPKALVEVNGKAIIDYQLELLEDFEDIRVVVGYMEEDLIKHIKAIRSDIIFVRNPDFKNTTTLQSVYLATKGIKDKCLVLDGDMIITKNSFDLFCEKCNDDEELIAISKDISDNPVYVMTREDGDKIFVDSFSRELESKYEWSNMAYMDPQNIQYERIHVYQSIERNCPVLGVEIDRVEVDTEEDLKNANEVILNNKIYR